MTWSIAILLYLVAAAACYPGAKLVADLLMGRPDSSGAARYMQHVGYILIAPGMMLLLIVTCLLAWGTGNWTEFIDVMKRLREEEKP